MDTSIDTLNQLAMSYYHDNKRWCQHINTLLIPGAYEAAAKLLVYTANTYQVTL